jgi:hypothetical protein
MHPRNIQFDPNMQMNALYAAARAEAKREAERTRKKLRTFASTLLAECDSADCVVKLSGDDASQGQAKNQGGKEKQDEDASAERVGSSGSYWA